MLLLWTNSLSVGVKELDDGTKKLIKCINELHHAIRDSGNSGVLDKEEIEIVMHRLENHAIYHCRREEVFLASIQYTGLAEQEAEHQRLAVSVAEMSARLHDSTSAVHASEIMHFIYDWVTNHIYVMDGKIRELLQKQTAPSRQSPRGNGGRRGD